MTEFKFCLSEQQLKDLLVLYPNMGKNSDVGKMAVEIAKLYFLSVNDQTTFKINKNRIDLTTTSNGTITHFEIKGTSDKEIAWNKLKVSSKRCHDHLLNGMTLVRITNVGEREVRLFFLKHDQDFVLKPEPRWSIVQNKF